MLAYLCTNFRFVNNGGKTKTLRKNTIMTPRLSGHFSVFGLVFLVPKSLLGIAR